MPRFAHSVVLITGASAGIGAALAREFAREGADLALCGRRSARLTALATELACGGRRAIAVRCDVRTDGDIESALTQAKRSLGPVDVVVANAGFAVVGPLERLSLDDYRRQFETNVFGVLRTAYAALDDLKRTRGRLVIIGSVSGHLATPGASAYAMSKFAVRGLAEALGHELAPYGVSVTLISPGFVDSEIRRVDNHGVLRDVPADDVIPAWLIMPTTTAARHILRAVAARRREAVITVHGKIAVALQRHVPGLVAWGLRRFGVSSRRQPGAAEKGASGNPSIPSA